MTFAICQSSIAEPAYRQPRRRENGLEFHPADVVPAGAIKVNNRYLRSKEILLARQTTQPSGSPQRKLQSRPKVSGARYSGIKGIYRRGGSKRWEVGIEGRGGRRHLSSVGTKEEAIQIYKRVAVKIGHADAECFFTKNPYKGQFLNLHQTPKEVLLAPLPWEIAVMMPTNSDTPSTFQMQLQPEHNTQCDRTHPQIGASRALQHYQLPHLEDNLEGFEGLPGSEDNALSALTGADYPRTEGQTHLSGPRAVTQYLPNGLKYTQVITCGTPSVFSLQPCESMQPYTSIQHNCSSCVTPAAPLHHLPDVSSPAAHSWQADNSQHAQYSQHARYPQHAQHSQHARCPQHAEQSEQAHYSEQADYSRQADYSQQANYSWYPQQADAVCEVAVSQPLSAASQALSTLDSAVHMHARTYKKDSSALDIAAAPPQVGEAFADRLGSCITQPCGFLQHNQQETFGDIDAGFWEDLIGSEDQICKSAGPSL